MARRVLLVVLCRASRASRRGRDLWSIVCEILLDLLVLLAWLRCLLLLRRLEEPGAIRPETRVGTTCVRCSAR